MPAIQKLCEGKGRDQYVTAKSYPFGHVLWALGAGTVYTYNNYEYSYKLMFNPAEIEKIRLCT